METCCSGCSDASHPGALCGAGLRAGGWQSSVPKALSWEGVTSLVCLSGLGAGGVSWNLQQIVIEEGLCHKAGRAVIQNSR